MNPLLSITTGRISSYVSRGAHFLLGTALLAVSFSGTLANTTARDHTKKTTKPVAAAGSAALKPVTTPVRLSYLYKTGDVRRYKVTGFFNGHIPPFSSAGSPPIHLMLVLDYAATVKKSDEKGAVVAYDIENAEVSLLEDDPGPTGKVDPEKVAPFPVPLSQIQKTLNVTATIKPDGSVTDIKGGDTASVKIDLGIDLRKLFLVTAPVIFSDKPIKTGDEWPFSDGLLGNKPGKTTYKGRLIATKSGGNRLVASVGQQADAEVENKLDKEGNSTEKADDVVGSLVGKVNLTGTTQFTGNADSAAGSSPGYGGNMTEGQLTLVVDLKRTLPDPDQPGKQQTADIDVHARLFVKPTKAPAPTAKTKGAADASPGKKAVKKENKPQ